jgi:hypothetical protein
MSETLQTTARVSEDVLEPFQGADITLGGRTFRDAEDGGCLGAGQLLEVPQR